MNGLGVETGISLEKLVETGDFISKALNRPNGSKVGAAMLKKKSA
jgi:hydroxymethylglutaryl-CoA lyase